MKINWKLRLQNKTTLTAIIVSIVALAYQVCGFVGFIPAVSESDLISFVGVVINLLCMLGIVVDPTTSGVSDSSRAMGYQEPNTEAVG